jgi:S1-C subfamily serine protease
MDETTEETEQRRLERDREFWSEPLGWSGEPESDETAPGGEPAPHLPEIVPEPPGRSRRFVAVFLAGLLGAGTGTGVTLLVADRGGPAGGTTVRVAPPLATSADGRLSGVSAVAKSVTPSIVRIDVTTSGFLGEASGTGSGVIYRTDGYIITNNHVVEGARQVEVTLSTGESLPARVVGTAAPADDIAVIKVDRTNLPAASFGTVANLTVGDLAVAIGSPFGLQGTVTAGVISALHRNITLGPGARFTDAIQTDAPINPGNSGGALAGADGSVIGINTAILGGTGGNVGVGFAIPIDIAIRDAEQIITTGRAQRPFLGIQGENIPNDGGALLQEVVPGGPAERAGLRRGDIIVAIDGSKIASMDDLISFLSRKDVGAVVTLTFTRDGARRTVKATLAARPEG